MTDQSRGGVQWQKQKGKFQAGNNAVVGIQGKDQCEECGDDSSITEDESSMISVPHIIVLRKNDVEYFGIVPGPGVPASRRERNDHGFDGSLLIPGVDFARGAVQEADQRKGVVANNDARGIA